MSDIAIRKQENDKSMASSDLARDPWRAVRALLAWDPFREMTGFPTANEGTFSTATAFDIKETKDAYEFKADVPGVPESDLDVSVTGNRLSVSGKREAHKEDKSERYYTYERSYGSFTRSFTLPDGADVGKLRASLDKGVLTITVPKKPEVQSKKITVRTEGPTPSS